MLLDADVCYRAVRSHDHRFDGHLFVGVVSTGVYCRPVCRARAPRRENCTFFPSAAAAEGAGYRPCLRCRPELAPGHVSVDAGRRLASAAARLIEEGALVDGGVGALAGRLGVTVGHLRRVFADEFGASPVAYAQTYRLLLAKHLLTDTRLSVADVAMVSGFGSLRGLNALFRARYGLRPSDLRRSRRDTDDGSLALVLAYRPPYAWDPQLEFLAGRAIAGVEEVGDGAYRRAVELTGRSGLVRGWIEVSRRLADHTLRVVLSADLLGALPQTLARVKRLFDLSCRPEDVSVVLGPLAAECPGLRVPGAFDGFEMAVRAVLGQQITVQAARTLAGRLAQRCGAPLSTPWPGVARAFPGPKAIAAASAEELGALGINRRRVQAMQALAKGVLDGALTLEPGADPESQIERLRALPSIGDWTAQYIAMRALAWPDAFPHADYGVMKALGERSPSRVLERAEAWRPWRGYATVHLWRSLKGSGG